MDRFGRYYAWLLLASTALPALLRLLQNGETARMTSERMATPKKRSFYLWLGWGSVIFSLGLGPVYFLFYQRSWLLVAMVIGVLSGIETIGNAHSPATESLMRQNRVFGAIYGLSALLTYIILLR